MQFTNFLKFICNISFRPLPKRSFGEEASVISECFLPKIILFRQETSGLLLLPLGKQVGTSALFLLFYCIQISLSALFYASILWADRYLYFIFWCCRPWIARFFLRSFLLSFLPFFLRYCLEPLLPVFLPESVRYSLDLMFGTDLHQI